MVGKNSMSGTEEGLCPAEMVGIVVPADSVASQSPTSALANQSPTRAQPLSQALHTWLCACMELVLISHLVASFPREKFYGLPWVLESIYQKYTGDICSLDGLLIANVSRFKGQFKSFRNSFIL